jgi:hypothetical protein
VHEPKPSHKPVLPQVLGSLCLQSASDKPAGTKEHRPTDPVCVHDTQEPLHATLQHTPSTQKLEAQSSPEEQTAPLALLPHLLATHSWSAAQSPLVVQE